MKLLLLPLAAALSGVAWFAGRPTTAASTDDACAPCPTTVRPSSEDCKVDVECTDEGTCVITCEGPGGKRCVIELACTGDGECEVVRCDSSGCEAPRR
jgi:hypothetical protein